MTKDHYKHEKIKELREAAGFTQEELAIRIKAHCVTVSRIETGKSCSFFLLCKLAKIFDIPWQSLMRLEDIPSQNIPAPHDISCCVQ